SERGWNKVENLKTPINSIADDFGIVMNESQSRGFFSSDRFNGMGREDIFTLYREEPLQLSFHGNELKIMDNTLYSGITFKLSKENDDRSEALVSEKGFYSCTLHEDTLYNLTLRKNRFFYDVVKLKITALSDEENFSIDVIPRKTSVILSGIVAEKNVEIKMIESEEPKKTKKEESEMAVLYDTIVEYKAVPFADLILTTEGMELEQLRAGKDGNFNFEQALPGGTTYKVIASKNEEEREVFEEFAEEEIEPEEQVDDIEEELLAEEELPVQEEEKVSPENFEEEILKEFMESGQLDNREELKEADAVEDNSTISEKKPEEVISTLEIKGALVDEIKEAIEGGNVKVFNGNDLLGDTESNERGEFEVEVPEKEKYLVSVTKEGFFQEQLEVSKDESLSGIPVKVDLKPIEVNKTIRINNIFFDYNKYDLRPESLVELDRLSEFLTVNPDVEIELNAHTDSRGGYYFNLQLSQNRAEAVKSYLSLNGIDPSRIIVRGFGESFPDIPNPTNEAEHARNRRVEFKVIEYGKSDHLMANAMMHSKGYVILDECPYSSVNPFPLTGDLPQGLVYRVKIGEYRNALPNNAFRGLFPVIQSKDEENNTWEYFAGLFHNLEDAEIAVEMIRRKICKDAYVTASYNREPVSIEEALKITEKIKKNQKAGVHIPKKDVVMRDPEACFSIQIGAFKRKVKNTILEEFRNIAGDHELISIKSQGVTIYSLGRFYSYEEAFRALKNITDEKRTKDAFIIGLQDGRKISIGAARNYLKRHKSAMR
ncbi:MAG: OmpA family protein, partial [Bacteroidota bacterium]